MSVRTIGVLGAGQLGRMLALAGYSLGLRFEFLSDREDDCAAQVGRHTLASYEDADAVGAFARRCDVVTYEFENVPIAAADAVIAAGVALLPGRAALEATQDRVREKELLASLDIDATATHAVSSADEARAAVELIGPRIVLKTRRQGYDGKGQRVVASADDAAAAYEALGGVELVAEAFVPFSRELSTIAVRAPAGDVRFYPLNENRHEGGILRSTIAPAPDTSPELERWAQRAAVRLMEDLDHVGVLTIEWFQVGDRLIANEIAPRVHNSGHWTIDAASTSQFENHVRAIAGLPLGSARATQRAEMTNLIGDVPEAGTCLEGDPELRVHLYGKSARPGRKVGHITRLGAGWPAPGANEVRNVNRKATDGAAGRVPNR